MIKEKKVSITIKDQEKGGYLQIPVVPSTISYTDGSAIKDNVHILDLGSVSFPNGVDLDRAGWNSFFPGRYDPSYCAVRNLLTPVAYRNRLSSWKDNATPLQLIIPALGINKRVTINDFVWEGKGFEGDIHYSVEFEELKKVRPIQVATNVTVVKKPKSKRSPKPKKPKPKTYKVKRGDTLYGISKKLGIKNWRTGLYNPNKKPKGPLGPNPNLIYPGQVLKV